ncbi:MAG: hypothetical protein GOMPHAMPRED_004655 [Gomphillus americanus]|uniref:Uncharacterized protein n=1 Tax=Gomphillus americanus TaxID=1940652 RepID=A0A8H3FLS5_9LECA|nr:MAG: hypothetical protein GOMPHAMPRED_004655 [Gomphillus americanus]
MAYKDQARARNNQSALKSRFSEYAAAVQSPAMVSRVANARGFLLLLLRRLRRHLPWIIIIVAITVLEILYHIRSPLETLAEPLDKPFATGCRNPPIDAPRANATLLMLARNSDVNGAVAAIRSVEDRFNHWAHYPIIFLNDEPFNSTFTTALSSVSSGEVTFATIPRGMWSMPSQLNNERAQKAMVFQKDHKVPYGGMESYHHMCRFNSGFFYDMAELQKYRWYWRIEPNVRFTCDITYDPFIEMQRAGKKYGYIIALWELIGTAPTLYRKLSDYKTLHSFPTTRLWSALIKRSIAPWPIRKMLALTQRNRNSAGDKWNTCHFWSNFEIADMDWYRGPEYRNLFSFLDQDGGFYLERWGDAPIHTLAAAMLLKDSEIHHFRDWGYSHPPFQYIPATPKLRKKGDWKLGELQNVRVPEEVRERNEMRGCNCEVSFELSSVIHPYCANVVGRALYGTADVDIDAQG